ncbi:MAG: mechanosensitive ion channel family protein [Rickettsiales bacterium]|jgi:MscS family membrane protein|nr:mechanosensitive ion channel family protein [Rickettsiales bacterium]
MLKEYILNDLKNSVLVGNILVSAICLVFAFGISRIISILLKKLQERFENTGYISSTALLLTIKAPLHSLIWVMCVHRIMRLANHGLIFLYKIKIVLVILVLLWAFFRFISKYISIFVEKKEKEKSNVDYAGIDFIKKLSQVLVLFIATLTCLGKLGMNFQSLMAIGGASGLAVGFAAKDLLANIFATLTLYIDKPFSVGDWISSPDRQIEGDVEEIGWRQTRILTFEKYPVYIANSVFTNIIIENKSRAKSRRILEIIPIRYTDASKLEKIVGRIKEMLKSHSSINHRLTTVVALENISEDTTLNVKLCTFVNMMESISYAEIKQDVLLKTIKIVHDCGCELGYSVKEIILKTFPATGKESPNVL